MDVRYLLLFLLVSCLPASQVSKGNLATNGSGGTTDNTSIPESATRWNYLGALTTSININASNLNNAYIAGKNIETFLNIENNFTQDYCLVSRYNTVGNVRELRTRVIPISYYDFTTKRTVKIFRVDFNNIENSSTFCNVALPLKVYNSNLELVSDTATVFSKTINPSLLCTTCTNNLTSISMVLFKPALGVLEEVATSKVDIHGLSLAVDPNNTVTTNPGTCTLSDCQARGFNCCLDNQCITDGAVRAQALTPQYNAEYLTAEQERLSNTLAYIKYPHLYYVCGTSTPPTTGGSNGGSYEQGLEQLKKDYFCVEHMKKAKTGATFHQDVAAGLNFFADKPGDRDVANTPSTLYPSDIECRNNAAPDSIMNYKKVTTRLYQQCGCNKTTLEDMITYCPAYEYSVNYMENGLPNRIDCYTPPTVPAPEIPTNQTVSVSSRSAPHRYFRSCGKEFGQTGTCPLGDVQEGDSFSYLDSGNIVPSQEGFGMNSILGPMNVTLDKAVPAKAVSIEYDQVYNISTTSGMYTPCPTCSKDSWYTSFSAHPSSTYGIGLQAVGHSTSRDSFDGNTTLGNYEDTIFGRACWVPPTMLPFSHYQRGTDNNQEQRLARLKTQAALYANGYQRDWFGFNKGALIGSFDGVSWFAVGTGRIVRSTSKKLYLAINAPFADLASPTMHVVSVRAYDGLTQAAQVDYDPSLHSSHAYQNMAGNCQANHMCNTDRECVSKLGWEYMCSEVQDVSTLWPEFNENGVETINKGVKLTIDQILAQKRFPTSNTKRCVYRGAGSLCIPNAMSVTDLAKRKNLTCAPNFYCADVASSGAVFNNKVSRYAGKLEDIPVMRNHLYGKDANVLGRPLSYTSSALTTTLPEEVVVNLTQSLASYEPLAQSGTGICLPGKALPEDSNQATMRSPYEQHKRADSLNRTDFISQIGGCNSGLFSANRYASCPVINSTGNYEFLSSSYNLSQYSAQARTQNSCGLDSLQIGTNLSSGADELSGYSPFRAIEAKPLGSTTVLSPSFARDACMRRADSVCHTDLDCGPNRKHAEEAGNFHVSFFGNEAERNYYSEYLVCGQANPKPSIQDTLNYRAYDMSQNRCCREIGSTLTTYTSYSPLKVNPIQAFNQNASTSDDHYETVSYGLKMTVAPGMAPNDPYRYSRLATVDNLGIIADRPTLTAFQDRVVNPLAPATKILGSAQGANVMTPNQWKTLGEANSESCCGGGWIRKFSDGSTDWTKRDRVTLDVGNFACINSRSVMLTTPKDVADQYGQLVAPNASDAQSLANADMGDYCKSSDGQKGSCAQYGILETNNDTGPLSAPIVTPGPGVDTFDKGHFKTGPVDVRILKDFYYYPRSTDSDPAIIIDNAIATGRRNISIKIPSYITRTSFDHPQALLANGSTGSAATRVVLYDINSSNETDARDCEKRPATEFATMNSPTVTDAGGVCNNTTGSGCCYTYNSATRVLRVMPDLASTFSPVPANTKKIGLKIINAAPAGSGALVERSSPGSSSYYLRRLGKIELSGIPQVNYQPLACNDNAKRLLPGMFKISGLNDPKVADFNQDTFSFPGTYVDPDTGVATTSRYTNKHGLAHEPVFSENDFKCCAPLGTKTANQNKCCSGYGVSTTAGSFTCSLPSGTDLMVYFNRYVSNEGRGVSQPGGGLEDTDFHPVSGEPKLNTQVEQKMITLGSAYCASGKVRVGGAFGAYNLEPSGNDTNQNERIFNIVDSSSDIGTITTTSGTVEVGYRAFMDGFRWNHHLYCDEM